MSIKALVMAGIFLISWLVFLYYIVAIWVLLIKEGADPFWQRLLGVAAWMRAISGDESGLSIDTARQLRRLRRKLGISALGIAAFLATFLLIGPVGP